jgi:acyl-CoA dehydrogenase
VRSGTPLASSAPTGDDRVAQIVETVRSFVRRAVLPHELPPTEATDELRLELQAHARDAGVFGPTVPVQYGGLGLSLPEQALVLEEAGYSLLGPLALNCAAPDEGNIHLLNVIATDAQRESYLRPLATGAMRSCFAMTEPAPGAGSDPSMLRTSARRADGGWRLTGRKWLITGAENAAFSICIARTGDDETTMFLVDAGTPGFTLARRVPTRDTAFPGGHGEIEFNDCFVPDANVLGEVGQGLTYAQVRLAPARLTHCMRWLGIARRSLDIALDYAAERDAFGSRLDQLGVAQALIADSVIDIETSRATIAAACKAIDEGQRGGAESSVAKVYVSEAVYRVVDRAVQLCGGRAMTDDEPLAQFLIESRAFRIYDGASEVHRWSIARRAARRRATVRARADG